MSLHSTRLVHDTITGETFGNIRIGSIDELRLFRAAPSSSLHYGRNDTGTKLFFGPLDDPDMQGARYAAYMNRTSIYDQENSLPMRKRRGRRHNKPLEIPSDQLFPGEII